mmetsp:Transcript_79284/g.232894  ORF Transcript_79284/g.232894 Transcript_79284/m.232894 type:complete len:295 (-) Transcript_79284:13-897(-)
MRQLAVGPHAVARLAVAPNALAKTWLATAQRCAAPPEEASTELCQQERQLRQLRQRDRVFANLKSNFLRKPDKSHAGRIDPGIAPLCEALNRRDDVFTSSSCAGRALLWLGDEPPAKRRGAPAFLPRALSTHEPGGVAGLLDGAVDYDRAASEGDGEGRDVAATVWLRFEPLVLHVCCRDWPAAQALLAAARSAGLKKAAVAGPGPGLVQRSDVRAWHVAIEGDERLEMPLVVGGQPAFPLCAAPSDRGEAALREWLESALRRKFERNAGRTQRFLEAVVGGMPQGGGPCEEHV